MFSPPKFESPKNSTARPAGASTTAQTTATNSTAQLNNVSSRKTFSQTNHQQSQQQQQHLMPHHNPQSQIQPPLIQVNQFSIADATTNTSSKQTMSSQTANSQQLHGQPYHSHNQSTSFTPKHSTPSHQLDQQLLQQHQQQLQSAQLARAGAATSAVADQSFQSKYLDQFSSDYSHHYNNNSQLQLDQQQNHFQQQQQLQQQNQQQSSQGQHFSSYNSTYQQQQQQQQQHHQKSQQQHQISTSTMNMMNSNVKSQFLDQSPIHPSQFSSNANNIHLAQQSQQHAPQPSHFNAEYLAQQQQQQYTGMNTNKNILYASGQGSAVSHHPGNYLPQNMQLSCGCSDGSWQLVRDQLRQIKQLSSDHLFASQESQRFKDLNEDMVSEIANLRSQIVVLEQKLILYEKESASKLQAARDKIRTLETFNKDLFTKLNLYESAIANYESELKGLAQSNHVQLQVAEDEKNYLKANLDSLHDTMNETLAEAETKFKSKIDTKNSKIKQYKQKIATDNELIESYQTELVQLQTENKLLKDDLLSIQVTLSNFQAEQQNQIDRIQAAESEAQQQMKSADDYHRKFEEAKNQLSMLLQNQLSDGDEQYKRFQTMSQVQISDLMHESSELKTLISDYHQRCINLEIELSNSSTVMHTAFNAMLVLIDSKGHEEVDIDATLTAAGANSTALTTSTAQNGMNPNNSSQLFNQNATALIESKLFEEVRDKLLHLIVSKHSLKKKKKNLLAKNEELKDSIQDLKATLHQVVSERQEEILFNESQQLKYQMIAQQQQQLLSQQQQQQQQEQTATTINSEFVTLSSANNFNQQHSNSQSQQHAQRPNSANGTNPTQPRNLNSNPLRASIQPTSSSASRLVHSSNWLEDPTVASNNNRQSQFISFQQQQQQQNQQMIIRNSNDLHSMSSHFNLAGGANLNYEENNETSKLDGNISSNKNSVLIASNERQSESHKLLYQQKIEEILELQTMNHTKIIGDLKAEYAGNQSTNACLIYALGKVIQQLLTQLAQVRRQVVQSTEILFSYINHYKRYSLEAGSAYTLKKHVRSIVFIRRLKQSLQETKQREGEQTERQPSMFSNDQLFQLKSFLGEQEGNTEASSMPVMRIVSRIRDMQFDVDLFKKVKEVSIGSPELNKAHQDRKDVDEPGEEVEDQEEVEFPIEQFKDLAALFYGKQDNSKNNDDFHVIHEESILFKSAENERERLQKEKEVIESDNVQLKQLIVDLHEKNEELQRNKVKVSDHYKMVLNQYEVQIMKLQQENENHLENNSKLVDSLDPRSRQFLAQQSVLSALQSSSTRLDENNHAGGKYGRSHSQHSQQSREKEK